MTYEGNSVSSQNDYLKVRVFLYKYTPPFTPLNNPLATEGVSSSLNQGTSMPGAPTATYSASYYEKQNMVSRFSCPFDPQYFSRFEITSFLHTYQATQSLKDMGNTLKVSLLNDIVSMKDLTCPAPSQAPAAGSSIGDSPTAYGVYSTGGFPRTRRPVFFPKKSTFPGPDGFGNYSPSSKTYLSANDLVTNIAQYNTEVVTEFALDAIRTEVAMRLRGVKDPTRLTFLQQEFAQASYPDQLGVTLDGVRSAFQEANAPATGIGNNLGQDGLLLSDLIQKFDMISVVVYRWPFPPDLVEQHLAKNQPSFFDTEPMMFACPVTLLPVSQLPSAAGSSTTIPLYESEFLGFVSDISFSANPGSSAPMVNIGARGVADLLNSSRRIYAASVYQTGIYDMGEMPNVQSGSSPGQSPLYANTLHSTRLDSSGNSRVTSPIDILSVLLREFYHIKFNTPVSPFSSSSEPSLSTSTPPTTCYIDIAEMEWNNNVLGATAIGSFPAASLDKVGTKVLLGPLPGIAGPPNYRTVTTPVAAGPGQLSRGTTNFLSIPSYLYGQVMRMRRFNVNVTEVVNTIGAATNTSSLQLYSLQTDAVGDSPLVINANFFGTEAYTTYFLRMNDALGQYNPSTKTATEIIRELNAMSYTEFFETPGGRLVFRSPQWNNITHFSTDTSVDTTNLNAGMYDSSQIAPISFEYSESKDNLISGFQLSVALNFVNGPLQPLYPRYSNGKVLSQYGFLQEEPISNSNTLPRNQAVKPPGERAGLQQFCRFFYEFNNAILKNGTISYVGNSQIAVGQTFFDITNQKFGYVTAISKHAQVGGTYVASASLSMVRNAMPIATSAFAPPPSPSILQKADNVLGLSPSSVASILLSPAVYALPTLESVVNAFNATPNSVLNTPAQIVSSVGAPASRVAGIQRMSSFVNTLSKTNQFPQILTGNSSNN